jgi:hypothetical protein
MGGWVDGWMGETLCGNALNKLPDRRVIFIFLVVEESIQKSNYFFASLIFARRGL